VPILGAIYAWVRRIERKLGSMLTRDEHERICMERNKRVERSIDDVRGDIERRSGEHSEKLDALKDMMERQSEQTQLHRTLVGDALATIRTQVAVIRDRMGDDPLKDASGSWRRERGS